MGVGALQVADLSSQLLGLPWAGGTEVLQADVCQPCQGLMVSPELLIHNHGYNYLDQHAGCLK